MSFYRFSGLLGFIYIFVGVLSGCGISNTKSDGAEALEQDFDGQRLQTVLQAQPPEHQARYRFRRPQQTLEFFDIAPGETVFEVLPGGGWYSQILAPYLGNKGKLIGVDYELAMFPNFSWVNEEFMQKRSAWHTEWQQKVQTWGGLDGAAAQSYNFDTVPSALDGQVDTVLFIRGLHNLARFEHKGGYLTRALQVTKRVLKPGGKIGIVQHQAREDKSDTWADGSKGYLKKSKVIAMMEAQGFRFVGEKAFNENPLDQPGENDIVWRLPPSLSMHGDDEALKRRYQAIGESHRMTLLFEKP